MYDIYCKEFHKGRGDSLLEKKYQIHLQNHYDATSRQVQKKEIKVLKTQKFINWGSFPISNLFRKHDGIFKIYAMV